MKSSLTKRDKIRLRIRKKIHGTAECPRLSVFRSNKGIYCQLIDDDQGQTLASAASSTEMEGNKTDIAKSVGLQIAEKAKAIKIDSVVFDRAGYLYHGRVKALADGAREGGLQF